MIPAPHRARPLCSITRLGALAIASFACVMTAWVTSACVTSSPSAVEIGAHAAQLPDAQFADAQCQPTLLVAFHSRDGHTAQMAGAIADGARTVEGTRVELSPIAKIEESVLLAADAIVLGSPVYNGNPTAEMLKFIEGWPFEGRPFEDRVGAAFVSAGGISAGEEGALQALHRAMLVFGMIVVGGEDWRSALGASAVVDEPPFSGTSVVGELFLSKAKGLGRRVATVTRALRCGVVADGGSRAEAIAGEEFEPIPARGDG